MKKAQVKEAIGSVRYRAMLSYVSYLKAEDSGNQDQADECFFKYIAYRGAVKQLGKDLGIYCDNIEGEAEDLMAKGIL